MSSRSPSSPRSAATSAACSAPGRLLRRDPALAVASFEENADADVLEALGIPGAPYAIAMDPTAPCSRRARSTISPTSRASSRPPCGGGPSGSESRRSVSERRRASSARSRGSPPNTRPPRLPRARRRGDRGRRRGRHRLTARPARRGRRLPLLRPHLHDRLVPASARRSLPRIDRAGFPLRGSDGHPIDNLGRPVNKRASPSARTASRSSTPTDATCRRRRGRSSARTSPSAPTASQDQSTAAGTAAAAARSASSSTAARPTTSGSTATRRCRATASRTARSSASCTTTRTFPADGAAARRARRRRACSSAPPERGRPVASR